MKIEIHKIDKSIKGKDPLILQQHRTVVVAAEDLYPGIEIWYDRKVKSELVRGERIGYLVQKNGIPVGAAIAKQGRRSKICTVRILEEAMSFGLGRTLFYLIAMNLRGGASTVHFTAPESLWRKYEEFFKSMKFNFHGKSNTQYRSSDTEIIASAAYSEFLESLRGYTFTGTANPQCDLFVNHDELENTNEFNFSSNGEKFIRPYARPLARIDGERIDLIFSVKPKHAKRIVDGIKVMELRRKFSKKWIGCFALIYSSAPERTLVAKVKIKNVIKGSPASIWGAWHQAIDCEKGDYDSYTRGIDEIYGILLDEIKPIDPVSKTQLEYLLDHNLVPPQSYCNVKNNPLWESAIGITHLLQQQI